MGCTEATSRAISRMCGIIFLPLCQSIGTIFFLIMFLIYGVYVASLGDIASKTETINGFSVSYRVYQSTDFTIGAGVFLLFSFFVTIQFIVALGSLAIATSIAKWYFTRDKSKISNATVCESVSTTMRCHQGTAAFGSIIIGLVQLIRAIISWVHEAASKADNKFAEGVLCCCSVCVCCFESFLKYINKNAYIQTAIFGYGFCEAAQEAFYLILRNAARVGAIEYVAQTLTIVGRLLIVAATTALSYVLISETIVDELKSIWNPLFVIAVIAYFISDMFMDVYDMGVSTILQCFIADEEMFDGEECYAENELQEWINDYEQN